MRENEAWETAPRNSEINTVLMNTLIKNIQILLSLLEALPHLNKLQQLVKRTEEQLSPTDLACQMIITFWE
jgi:hypothetical protein